MATWLVALTEEARGVLHGAQRGLEAFPFRVGRESRGGAGGWAAPERRVGGAPPLNDLYLAEHGGVLQVSREHFQIEEQDGRHFIVDRGSACGTIVEGRLLGGARQGGRAELHDHDVIIVGTSTSPFRLQGPARVARPPRAAPRPPLCHPARAPFPAGGWRPGRSWSRAGAVGNTGRAPYKASGPP